VAVPGLFARPAAPIHDDLRPPFGARGQFVSPKPLLARISNHPLPF
jgi:hypothetical protein